MFSNHIKKNIELLYIKVIKNSKYKILDFFKLNINISML